MYTHFIFDIDGTLVDTEQTGLQSLHKTVKEMRGEEMSIEDLYYFFGIPSYEASKMLGIGNPDLFAGCVAICCGGTREEAERLKNMPVALYQGDYDETVRTELTRDFYKFLQEAGNTQCSYREYPLIAHNAWDVCYNDYSTLDWLFAQRKK